MLPPALSALHGTGSDSAPYYEARGNCKLTIWTVNNVAAEPVAKRDPRTARTCCASHPLKQLPMYLGNVFCRDLRLSIISQQSVDLLLNIS